MYNVFTANSFVIPRTFQLSTYRHSLAHSASVRSVHPVTPTHQDNQVYDSTLVVKVEKPADEWYWPGITREQVRK